jgi:membrane-associated phospholipid phosphatase
MEIARQAHDPAVAVTPSKYPADGHRRHATPVLEAQRGGPAEAVAERLGGHRPATVFALTAIVGYLVLLASAVGLGELLTQVILQSGSISGDDERINRWFVRERTPSLNDASYVGSMIGDIPILPGLVVLAVIVLLFAGRRILAAAFIASAGLIELATYRVTSLIVHRDRPRVLRLDDLPVSQSYPSGHTAASVAVYGGLALLITALFPQRWVRITAWTLAVLLPLGVATSRVYRGMHHVTDVAAGALIGIGVLVIAVLAARACDAAVRRHRAAHTTTQEIS